MRKFVLYSIRLYQDYLKEGILANIFIWGRCRFVPTCSEYTYLAIEKYGTIKGLFLGFGRILRCHPFSRGGVDPVK